MAFSGSFDWEVGDDDLPCEVFYEFEEGEAAVLYGNNANPGSDATVEVFKVLAGYSDRKGPEYELLGIIGQKDLAALEQAAWDSAQDVLADLDDRGRGEEA